MIFEVAGLIVVVAWLALCAWCYHYGKRTSPFRDEGGRRRHSKDKKRKGLFRVLAVVAVSVYAGACGEPGSVATEEQEPPGIDMYLAPDGIAVERFEHRPRRGAKMVRVRVFDHEGRLTDERMVNSYLDAIPPEIRERMTVAATQYQARLREESR